MQKHTVIFNNSVPLAHTHTHTTHTYKPHTHTHIYTPHTHTHTKWNKERKKERILCTQCEESQMQKHTVIFNNSVPLAHTHTHISPVYIYTLQEV